MYSARGCQDVLEKV
jgi:hypothetical protein